MTIEQYVDTINKRYKQGNTTEHSFRGDLLHLLETLIPETSVTNEPKRQTCGAPDYIISKREIPLGFIEAKDIGDADLNGVKKTGNKEQFDRYKASLNNIIFTDYLDFHLYHDGVFVTKITIAEIRNGSIVSLPNNFTAFINLIKDFASKPGQTIKSSKRLAEMMAAKARLLADVIEKALTTDEHNQENSTLADQMKAFKEILIHDITPKSFADVYAQTIAYGLFAARLHDASLPTFSRAEAAELIPKSNPFLRKLFGYIAGPDIDDRIKWIVDSLIEVFLHCNVEDLLKNYGKSTKTEDPIIHFYETFLSEYDPKLRKARGVWYTPHPVVHFIVRAVDDILKTEFGLAEGLANTGKTKIKVQLPETDKRYTNNIKTAEEEVHRVQILDPATGTGTFLAEVIKQIHNRFEGQQGIWSNYVETHLLPRLNGFELLMASYAMAHLQLDLLLTDTGYKPKTAQRIRVFLTNSLEESHPDTGTLFANWLSTEANEANRVKRDTPVMVVMGNPPYSVSSSNKGEWILNLLDDYKKDLNERKINLDDDYIKFIRFGQHFIDKNGYGVLAYISNNSFISGLTHRQMRKSLLQSFDKIYILDLHGDSNKKEVNPDGGPDQNVFDIMQGVSINIFIKSGQKNNKELAAVSQFDVFGKREVKYDFLDDNNLDAIQWQRLKLKAPNYFFLSQDLQVLSNYENGFSLAKLFMHFNSGIQTKRDEFTMHISKEDLFEVIDNLKINSPEDTLKKYQLAADGRDWQMKLAKADILKGFRVIKILYRPFDERYTAYTGNSKGFLAYPRSQTTTHLLNRNNLCLISCRQTKSNAGAYISKEPIDQKVFSAYDINTMFPLYLYPENNTQQSIGQTPTRTPNLNPEIVNKIAQSLNLTFTPEKETEGEVCFANNPDLRPEFRTSFAPIDILDYIYAVLHSPTYREKYKEFLKIDFPRVPYPKDAQTFWSLVKLGGELRQIHLLESAVVNKYITKYPVDGNNVVAKPKYENGKVYINETQYFEGVPETAWNFYIGGYQPAQKWLKDRKERQLSFEDILHYQKIIVALVQTDRIMKEIDKIEVE